MAVKTERERTYTHTHHEKVMAISMPPCYAVGVDNNSINVKNLSV